MRKLLFLFVALLSTFLVFAQQPTKEELQRKNAELAKEIAGIRADLDKAKGNKKITLGLLEQLNRAITKRNQVINNIKGEVFYIEKDIVRTRKERDTLQKELDTLKVQYAKSIVYAYKNRSNYDFLNFLFSAGNFNDALKRLAYLKTYRQYREQQAGRIKKANEQLKGKEISLTTKRADKNTALSEQNKQMNELALDKRNKDQALTVIKGQEQQLSATISKKEKQRQQNAKTINQIIKREIELARAEDRRREKARLDALAKEKKDREDLAKKNGTTTTDANNTITKTVTPPPVKKTTRAASALELTPEGIISSQKFELNKGGLPWPVSKGIITIPFGNSTIPGTGIKIISDGITIETDKGTTVKAIFEGEVRSVFQSPGGTQTVMILHGKYFTTYANLASASVSRGQKVTTGQAIGTAGVDDNGIGEMELRVDTERGPINPAAWIRR